MHGGHELSRALIRRSVDVPENMQRRKLMAFSQLPFGDGGWLDVCTGRFVVEIQGHAAVVLHHDLQGSRAPSHVRVENMMSNESCVALFSCCRFTALALKLADSVDTYR